MRWSLRIATISGIPVYLHATFVALIAFLFLSDWMRGRDVAAALGGVLYILAIFGAVVLHEFGHALMARRYGIRTRDITLLPIGGLARLERLPSVPRQELWVALAGPAVNVALAAAAGLLDRPAARFAALVVGRRGAAASARRSSASRPGCCRASSPPTSGWRCST